MGSRELRAVLGERFGDQPEVRDDLAEIRLLARGGAAYTPRTVDRPWRTRLTLVVPRAGGDDVLAVDGRLPEAELPGRLWYAESWRFVGAFGPGLEPVLLRLLRADRDEDERLLRLTLLAALPGEPPDGARWVHRGQVPRAAALLAEAGPPRQPWAEPGWFPLAADWLLSAVDGAAVPATGPVQQFKVWELSSVLRVPTTGGDVYFKATIDSPLFVPEAAVTALLADLFPEHVPAPLAVDRERGWIATADFGAEVGWTASVEVREAALRQYAALQRGSAEHVDRLLAAGCIDRRPAWLARQLPSWFAAETLPDWAEPELAADLAAAIPRLTELCSELATSPLPTTLLHGDMHMGNAARRPGGGFLFFDWTDAGVGHPFIDMIAVGQEDDEGHRERLRDAYLDGWSDVAGRADLDRAWAVADVLAQANQAVSYLSLGLTLRRDPAAGHSPLFASYTKQWLRTLLGALARLDGEPAAERAGAG